MDDHILSGSRLSRRQFAQSMLAFVGGASLFSNPVLQRIGQAPASEGYFAAPQRGEVGTGVLLLTGAHDERAQAIAGRLAQNGMVMMVSTAHSHSEADAAVAQLMNHPQLSTSTIAVVGVGNGTAYALRLAHSHPAVGAAVLIGNLPDNSDWQSDFALLQQGGAKTLILPGDLDEIVLGQVERFVRPSAL